MRTIGTAAEAYAVDTNRYPAAAGYSIPTSLSIPTTTINDSNNLQLALSPTYIKLIPMKDGWDSYFLYTTDANFNDYIIVSAGKDGVVSVTAGTIEGPTTDFNSDIVFVDGQFMQFPDGIQR